MSEYWTEDAPGRPSGIGTTLETGLVSYWRLDEEAGIRADAHGKNHLSVGNTLTQVAGKLGKAARFKKASGEYLFVTDAPTLATGDIDFTISAWVNLDGGRDEMYIASRGSDALGWEWFLIYDASLDFFSFIITTPGALNKGNADALAFTDSFGKAQIGAWNFVVAWHDSAKETVNIQVNNGLVDSLHKSQVNQPDLDQPTAGTGPFNLGAFDGPGGFLNGRLDTAAFWKRVLTSAERAALYNNGAGLDFLLPSSDFWVQTPDGIQDWQKPAILPLLEMGGIFGSTSLVIADGT